MKLNSIWTRKYQSIVDNGRNHSVVLDLPAEKGGVNSGPTALELCVMSYGGCISTICVTVAEKMRISFDRLEVELIAEQKDNAPTITDIHCIVSIKTDVDKQKIEKCFEHTENTCPVGILFKQAGIKITRELKFI